MAAGGEGPSTRELERRMDALADEVDELRELVDGHDSWSHRKRLHAIEDDRHASDLVQQAIDRLRVVERREHRSRWTQLREWGTFLVAVAAIVVAILARSHGAG